MPRSHVQRSAWLLGAAVLSGIAVIVVAALLSTAAARSERSQESVAARLEQLGDAQHEVVKLLLDVETGQRGYLLTGDREFLTPYPAALGQLPLQLDLVERLAADDPSQRAAAARLRALSSDKLRFSAATLAAYDRQGPQAAQALVLSGEGKHVMDELRSVLERSADEAGERRAAYEARAEAARDRAALVGTGAGTLVMALLGLMLWLVRERERADSRHRSDEQVRAALLAELEHQAVHDALTGQPNRRLLEDRISQALARSARDGSLLAVLFIDLDRFKHVNDRHGHAVGDQVLVATAERLRSILRSTDTLARIGGDEFVALCEQLPDESAAMALVATVQEQLTYRLTVEEVTVDVTASVGLVVADHLGMRVAEHDSAAASPGRPRPDALIAAADEAMYQAKQLGRARHHVYSSQVARDRRDRVALTSDLREALHGDEAVGGRLWVAFQPLVRLDTGEPVGAEALCRWTHPVRGEVSPGDFIPVAESSGLITTLGDLVLRTACRQLSEWNAQRAAGGLDALYVSVNCSARQLLHPGYTDRLAEILDDTGTDPRNLLVELTESVLVDTVIGAGARLRSLSDLGVRLALDDFGTGYSSLAYLRRFPFDVIKIDRSFASGLGHNGEDEAIVASVVGMARALGRTLVIEGIETSTQAMHARRLGCTFAQGYHYGRPQSPEALGRARSLTPDRAPELRGT